MNKYDHTYVILPTLNPNEEIMEPFLQQLKKIFNKIVIVNDGSKEEFNNYFNHLKKDYIVLEHYINLGKGRAIKTATNYILNNYPDCEVIVTADSDGQHQPEDILKCVQASYKKPHYLILGSRQFKQDNVPFKSRYGNIITRNVFRMFIGLNITDTQTGLRAMSKEVAIKFLDTKGERYEYETNTLIECKTKDIPIQEVKITTIYLNDNAASHFNPLKDSLSIYKLFFKYIFTSLSASVIDILLFAILVMILNQHLLLATIIARIISASYNFLVNAKLVFKKMNKASLIKYITLVFTQMFVSGFSVSYICHNLNSSSVGTKIIVDLIIFVANFIIQREWVFKNKR